MTRKISSRRLASMLPMAPSFQMPAEWTSWSSPPSEPHRLPHQRPPRPARWRGRPRPRSRAPGTGRPAPGPPPRVTGSEWRPSSPARGRPRRCPARSRSSRRPPAPAVRPGPGTSPQVSWRSLRLRAPAAPPPAPPAAPSSATPCTTSLTCVKEEMASGQRSCPSSATWRAVTERGRDDRQPLPVLGRDVGAVLGPDPERAAGPGHRHVLLHVVAHVDHLGAAQAEVVRGCAAARAGLGFSASRGQLVHRRAATGSGRPPRAGGSRGSTFLGSS